MKPLSVTIALVFLILLSWGAAGCATPPAATPTPLPPATPTPLPPTPTPPPTLTLVTHDSFDISEAVLNQFTAETGISVQILKSGDAGEMLNTLLLTKENPIGDVVFGIDNTFLSRALDADLFTPYASPLLADIPEAFQLDPQKRLLPVDYGFVTLNYDIAWFEKAGIAPPTDIRDLTQPAYKGLTVVENPASSSPGLVFLLITVGRFGETGAYTYLDYWRELRQNDVLVVDGWNEAYWGAFTVGSGGEGDRPIVVSYATSPAAEVYFNNLDSPPTASVNTPGNAFLQIEFVGILAKSPHREAATQLVDFMLSPTFQEDIPLHMFVYPVNRKADSGELFRQWAEIPAEPVTLDPARIAAGREGWIAAWTDVMLR
jgi:thiamine transport system substrate-binding protein